MATVAKGMITLSVLNDAYSVSLSPNSCVIHADFDGSNPILDTAYTNILVTRGDTPVKFELKLHGTSNSGILWDLETLEDGYTQRVKILGLPRDVVSGYLEFELDTMENFSTTITFQFSVERESTMLDWIQEWETNKTKIGSTYLITPKIFVGKRTTITNDERASGEADESTLTGVYIGPDGDYGESAGVYGYKNGDEIFHLNETGGMIGGWQIENGGIQTSDGKLQILSSGVIQYLDSLNQPYWKFGSDGSGVLAHGNITWTNTGSAVFNGKITAQSGKIGNWLIGTHSLYNTHIAFDSNAKLFGISNVMLHIMDPETSLLAEYDAEQFIDGIKSNGGVFIHYTSGNSFGLEGWTGSNAQVFSLGSTNKIAGWMFDTNSLYLGTKKNEAQQYASENSLTIGSNGLRGSSWYIDYNGEIDFMNGLIHFDENGGEIVGWKLTNKRLSTNHIALTSDSGSSGLYMCVADISEVSSTSLSNSIHNNGGLYIKCDGANCQIAAYDKNTKRSLLINSHGSNYIGGWNFDYEAIWQAGSASEGKVFTGFTEEGGINIAPLHGIRGHQWRLEADGSGGLAGDKIKWDKNGSITFDESVTMQWGQGIDLAQRMAYGRVLYRDPENEKNQYNGTSLYASSVTVDGLTYARTTRAIVTDSEAPTATQSHVIKYTATQWYKANDQRIGGFLFANQSRKNAQFIVKIIAKIPERFKIENYHNAYGTGAKTEWLTSQLGTGKYEEYRCLVTCGSSGSFSTINHFALEPTLPALASTDSDLTIRLHDEEAEMDYQYASVEWYVAYATVIDISTSDKLTTYIDNNGIYTGTLNAEQINAGTISASRIDADELLSNGEAWALKQNGSGWLAQGNITWAADGTLQITGEINAIIGKIGGWSIGEYSLKSENNIIQLISKTHSADGTYYTQGIYLISESSTGGSQVIPSYNGMGAKISLVPSNGTVETSLTTPTSYSTGTAYISPTGIFANLAGTQATVLGTGLTHRAAIVGLGFANLNKGDWELGRELTAVAGVYGRASNTGTAPAYGGYFVDLKACGFVANMLMVSDNTTTGTTISSSYTYVVGITNSGVSRTLYLPTDGVEGRMIFIKQMGAGSLRIETKSGQKLYDDISVNDYYELSSGQMAICVFQIYYIGGVKTEVWAISRFKY